MAVNPGDIAFTAYNADGTDSFSFVALATIATGEVINFTDNGWRSTNVFRTGEGTIAWTAPAGGVVAGTVVTLTASTATVGSITTTGSLNFNANGDGLIAYQGSAASPAFVFALNNQDFGWQADATDASTSALPTGLVEGLTAIAINEIDNTAYNGPTTGNAQFLLRAIADPANWGLRSDTTQQSGPASFTVQTVPTPGDDNFAGTDGADTIDLLAGNDLYLGGDGNDTITGGAGIDTLRGEGGDDVFVVRAGDTGAGEVYDGGTGTDTISVVDGGTVSLVGVTLTSIESISTDATNTNLTVTNQAMSLLVTNMGGTADVLTINAWTGGSFVVADLFSLLTGRGIEEVAWTQSIHDFTAILNGGTGFVDVTRTDFGNARNYSTQIHSFESDGDLRQQITNFDDGAVSTTNYDANGVITDLTIDATGAARTYQTLVDTYTGGLLDLSVLTANDGVTTTKDYDVTGPSSVLLTSVRDDVANAYAWDTITDTYTGNVLTQRVTVNDVGNPITSTEINYSGGVIADRTITYADGRLSETFFTGGVLDFVRNTAANGVDLTLVGGAGDNTLSGGAGNDLFVGGLGNDVFAFTGAVGADRISDFGNGQDRLDLLAYGYDSRADLDAANAVSQVGRNVVIDLGAYGSITLLNFQLANLDDNDFVI